MLKIEWDGLQGNFTLTNDYTFIIATKNPKRIIREANVIMEDWTKQLAKRGLI